MYWVLSRFPLLRVVGWYFEKTKNLFFGMRQNLVKWAWPTSKGRVESRWNSGGTFHHSCFVLARSADALAAGPSLSSTTGAPPATDAIRPPRVAHATQQHLPPWYTQPPRPEAHPNSPRNTHSARIGREPGLMSARAGMDGAPRPAAGGLAIRAWARHPGGRCAVIPRRHLALMRVDGWSGRYG